MKLRRKITSLLLCAAMLFSTVPQTAYAENTQAGDTAIADGLCEHHTQHDESCGYTEGTDEIPCSHEHTDDCYLYVTKCVHEHTAECYSDGVLPAEGENKEADACAHAHTEECCVPGAGCVHVHTAECYSDGIIPSEGEEKTADACTHECSEESGCITNIKTNILDCKHIHDEGCGYTPATEGTPCRYECKVCEVQELIDALPALPEMENMSDDDLQAAMEQYAAAYEAYEALTDEQEAQITGAEVFDDFLALMQSGTAYENFSTQPTTFDADIDVSDLTGQYHITQNGAYRFTGTNTDYRIRVADGLTVQIVFDNVTISGGGQKSPLHITHGANGSTVELFLVGTSTLKGGSRHCNDAYLRGGTGEGKSGGSAGIYLPQNATLIVSGEGTLNATGGNCNACSSGGGGGAGIGTNGNYVFSVTSDRTPRSTSGTYIQLSGTVNATGGTHYEGGGSAQGGGAGIGGGGGYYEPTYGSNSNGTTLVLGGTLTAKGSGKNNPADIGMGGGANNQNNATDGTICVSTSATVTGEDRSGTVKSAPDLTYTVPGSTVTYDGSAATATNVSSDSTGAVGAVWLKRSDDGWEKVSDASNVGTYMCLLTVAQDSTYWGAVGTYEVQINPRALQITQPVTKVYDGTTDAVSSLSVSNVVSGESVSIDTSATTAAFNSANVGEATSVSITQLGWTGNDANGNYTYPQATLNLNGSITQATNSWITLPTINGWIYGSTLNTPSGEAAFGTPVYTYSDTREGTYGELPANPHVGTWYMKAVVAETSNYTGLEEVVEFTISVKQLDPPSNISWDGKDALWDEVTNADNYTVTLYKRDENGNAGSVIKNDTTSNTKYDFINDITEAGTYYVTVVANGSGNYVTSNAATSVEVTYYTVNVGNANGGSATATPALAMQGTTITLEPSADTDYVFWKWDKDSNNTNLEINKDETTGEWKFTMPARNVTVTPVFEQNPAEPTVTAVTADSKGYDFDTWTTQESVTITVSGENTGSRIARYEYSTDNGKTWETLAADPATGRGTLTINTDTNTIYLFRTVTKAGAVGESVSKTVRIDRTAPEATINVNDDIWTGFLNTITFGKFFKKSTEVNITGSDSGSGVASVEYRLSTTVLTGSDLTSNDGWTSFDEVREDGKYNFNIEPNNKGSVYVRVKDNAGNTTVINSAGIVVYTDAAQQDMEIAFTRLQKDNVSFRVSLNENTVKSITIEGKDGAQDQVISQGSYSVDENTGEITLKADALKDLAAGSYTLQVDYDPMGEEYVVADGNEAPAYTTVTLTVQKNNENTDTATLSGIPTDTITYGDTFDVSISNASGTGNVTYESSNTNVATVDSNGKVTIVGVGDFTIKTIKQADADYNELVLESATLTTVKKALTISGVSIKDKQYDGTNKAEFDGTPTLEGVVNGDSITLNNGTPTFTSVGVGDNIPISFTPFTIEGEKVGNYELIQPTGITANIYNNFTPAQDTEYTVNSNDWINVDFVITAKDGYSLSRTNVADEESWSKTLTESDETENGTLTFYVRNDDTGAISLAKTETYQIDKTAPTGEIKIGGNGWREFLNIITFGHFFKDTQTVSIEPEDTLSGVAKVEYISSATALTLEEVKARTDWAEGHSVNVTPEEGRQFIYYARITDHAGNVLYISTDGAEFDLTKPVITGLTDGRTYCISVDFTVTDKNLDTVKVDGDEATAVEGVYTLTAGTHTVTVTDKAGNVTEVTVTVNPSHSFQWVIDKGATATQAGSKHEECTVCGYKKDPVSIPAAGTPGSTEAPATGDNSNITLWLVVLLMSGGAFLALIFRRRTKRNTDK